MPAVQRPPQDADDDLTTAAVPTGIFTAATVPESLVAHPPGQSVASVRDPAGTPRSNRGGARPADSEEAEKRQTTRAPLNAPPQNDEVCVCVCGLYPLPQRGRIAHLCWHLSRLQSYVRIPLCLPFAFFSCSPRNPPPTPTPDPRLSTPPTKDGTRSLGWHQHVAAVFAAASLPRASMLPPL